ncbi:Autoinducer synthesis protein LuxI [Rubellimicrobium mesophilum DSM 19309]|uniref:Acyl-homoserine-lactone synthase n=1 Tax=Rubellimicrobium mesophilum DSM 19309 TaxID=442562 RepID=A0A017HHH0_9RHOB|nr:acyl-homoserine-lactone synthase [Rubellimicrobium mesophilum]EYD73947.1 Autoinducer synthesis protein LuxI [Rubellimicrobium mesophilum DSM 19309]
MIIVIDAINRKKFGAILDEMFRLRARVFGDRLGWEVEVKDGKEIDRFDALDPAYVVGLDDEGHVISCARALQTTGPHMLADVFHSILDGEPPLRSATLWESTRFCVDTQRLGAGRGRNSVSYATCELMVGSLEFCMRSGISDIVTVIDPVMDRVLKRSDNAPYDYVGTTKQMGKVPAMAALLDCTEERIEKVRRFAGIEGNVFLTEDEALALVERSQAKAAATNVVPLRRDTSAEPPRSTVSLDDVMAYCVDQIRSAKTLEERSAALAVVREVLKATEAARAEKAAAPKAHEVTLSKAH